MKWIALIVLFASCTAARFISQGQRQGRLLGVEWKDHNRAVLTLLDTKGDTILFNYGSTSMTRPNFVYGDLYTIHYDSSRYKIINGKKYLNATIKHNQ